jgi:hypothetical protein
MRVFPEYAGAAAEGYICAVSLAPPGDLSA